MANTTLVITGCSDIINVEWDVEGATQMALIFQRHERIIDIGKTGNRQFFLVDEIQIRDTHSNVLASEKIIPCIGVRYMIKGQYVQFLQPGRYIIHKRMGWILDTYWKLIRKGEYAAGDQALMGAAGIYTITWAMPNNSTYHVDTVRIY